ncbi:MAG: phospholipase D-like domain-containing protein [Myxococcota bacterium]
MITPDAGRVVVIIEAGATFTPTLELARRLVPGASLHVAMLGGEGLTPRHAEEPLVAIFDALGVASVETLFDPAQSSAVARRQRASLVVVGPWPAHSERTRALAIVELASRQGFDVLSVGARCVVTDLARVGLAVPTEATAYGALTSAVRALPLRREVLAFVGELAPAEHERLEATLRALLPGLEVELRTSRVSPVALLEHEARAHGVGLLIVSAMQASLLRQVATGLVAAHALEVAEVPLLVLHRVETPALAERLVASDTLRLAGSERAPVSVERASVLGRTSLADDETFLVVGAQPRPPLRHEEGVVEVPSDWLPPPGETLALSSALLAATARVLRSRPLVLIDPAFPVERLGELEPFASEHECVVVRLRASETLEALRSRFDAALPWGGPLGLIDASAWLDDANALDVPQAVDGLRLLRLANRLVARGARVGAIVTSDAHELETRDFAVWTPATLSRRSPSAALSRCPEVPVEAEARWRWLSGAALVPGNAVELELENGQARARLLHAIDAAKQRVHWQSYIVDEDETAEEFGQALARAAARGVEVRVLVDALYSLHDAYGAKNAVLERLSAAPGVEVRVFGKLEGLPNLVALKRRNHRKLVIIDGHDATVSGRNLGGRYYRGFHDGRLSSKTPWGEVPWADASAALRGPLVETLDRAFLADWTEVGGAPFEVVTPPPAGSMRCRFVAHRGLSDAYTFEAQRELIDGARARVVLVNTFPYSLELQRAVLRALGRGVEVRILFGSVRPRWGDDLPFVGGTYRELADELVRSRIDPLLRAGAEGWEYAVPHPTLRRVFPNVHAKLYVRDEELVAVGSANLDVTSAFWESEALLLVHDAAFARRALSQLEGLFAFSRRVDVTGPGWADTEARREWLSRNWPNLMG